MKRTPPRPTKLALEHVPVGLIDEPDRPMRQTVDPDYIAQLGASLLAVGQLQPVVLERVEARYRIRAGHCRYLAARAVGLSELMATILAPGAVSTAAVTYHENRFREAVNPAEEADYFAALCVEECEGDTDRLAKLVCERREYVEERLLLRSADEEVFLALRRAEISMAVAREINKYRDRGLRRSRLEAAISGGATARVVREWRLKDEQLEQFITPQNGAVSSAAPLPQPAFEDPLTCFCCASNEEKHELELIYVHRGCKRLLREAIYRAGVFAGPGEGGRNATG